MRTKRVVIACLVEESCDGYQIVSTDSVGFFIKKEYLPKGIVPKPGDIIDLILEYGCEIVGIRMNGTLLFLKSEEEVAKEREKSLRKTKNADKKFSKGKKTSLTRDLHLSPSFCSTESNCSECLIQTSAAMKKTMR